MKEMLGGSIVSIDPIQQGQDGEKFKVTTSDGQQLFCKVKEVHDSQELPYQEADVLLKIDSPFIPKPIRIDQVKGHYVIIMPFIDGVNLEERIKKVGQLSLEEVKKLAVTLIECVSTLEEAGIVHFDIKPANIIFDVQGNYHLVDFGAAKFLKKMKTERVYPARKFIAPEVLTYLFDPSELRLSQLTVLTDMYGVGAVLYSAVTGREISEFFKNSTDILQQLPPPVRHFRANFDEVISNLIDVMLSKEPARRPLPSRATKILLVGNDTRIIEMPRYFLKTKPGRGNEHTNVLETIYEGGRNTGIYWITDVMPTLPAKTNAQNMLWEVPWSEQQNLDNIFFNQHSIGTIGLCVPASEFEAPLTTDNLSKNIAAIDIARDWKKKMANELPLIGVIAICESLLLSPQLTEIKNAYAAKGLDGIVLRICVTNNKTTLSADQLKAIAEFIEPWVVNNRFVLFDGDLSVIPLSTAGVSGLISTTYPKLPILMSKRVKPKFAQKPDGMYLGIFLSIIKADHIIGLRTNMLGRIRTQCNCPHCASTLMKRNKLSKWERSHRRKHFIVSIPAELASVKNGGKESLYHRVMMAIRETRRFEKLYSIETPLLRTWLKFLS